MSGRKRKSDVKDEKDEEYLVKRARNNEAVNRTRQKKRQEESSTSQRVEELRSENTQLERKVESLQKELSFLKEMFVVYANKKKDDGVARECAKASEEALDSARQLKQRLKTLKKREGISLLEVKNHDMVGYLTEIALLMGRMSTGKSLDGEPAVVRCVKHRTVLEKVQGIEKKMTAQIEKLTQIGEKESGESLRAKPEQMEFDNDEEEEDEEEEAKEKNATKKYVPPKVMAMHYDDREKSREEKRMEHAKRRAMQSTLVQELKEQYSEAPEEVADRGRNRIRQDKEREEYEETYMMRTMLTKKEKTARKREERQNALDDLLKFGDYMMGDENQARSADKKKKKFDKFKGKGKGKKRAASRGGGGGAAKRGRGGRGGRRP